MKRFLTMILAGAALVHGGRSLSFAAIDWLPSVPQGTIEVRLTTTASDFGPILGDYQTPTDIAFPSDRTGRKFVSMQLGNIRVIDAAGNVLPVFLDTRNSNTAPAPRHFTSLAFHNQFAKRSDPGYGKFYTVEGENAGTAPADFSGSLLTVDGAFQQVIYEYKMNNINDNVFAGTKREVMRFDRPGSGSGHNVSELTFGRDGYLYISSGDGGVAASEDLSVFMSENAQFLGNVYGKVLRIDPLAPELKPRSRDPISANGKYRVPRTNPFMPDPDPSTPFDESVDEIYAYGFRNPFRMSLDLRTSDLYVGSVGQAHIEAVYKVRSGANLGWNLKEGSFIYDLLNRDNLTPDVDADGNGLRDFAEAHGLTDPIFEYDHEDGVAVIGGFVYRGKQIPELYGKYIFADFAGGGETPQGRLFYGDLATREFFEMQLITDSEPLPAFIYSIGQDNLGELFLMGTSLDGGNGIVMQILPSVTVPKDLTSVPEPAAAALAIVAAFGMSLAARARRRK